MVSKLSLRLSRRCTEICVLNTEMEMKKLHMGTMSYGWDSMDEVAHQLVSAFGGEQALGVLGTVSFADFPTLIGIPLLKEHVRRQSSLSGAGMASKGRRDISSRLRDAVLALATCHNVSL